ncbi:MAG: hypothetical protein NC034_01085 [Ruminococcus sp.]|nr:hypothetical protein [Ruminococcus sp.]
MGAIFAGFVWVANIGESICESSELMTDYINGDENAGKQLYEKAFTHVVRDVALANFGMAASEAFAKTHLVQKLGSRVGSFFVKEFERTSIGCDGALEILNRISPKYTDALVNFINQYKTNAADYIIAVDNVNGILCVS